LVCIRNFTASPKNKTRHDKVQCKPSLAALKIQLPTSHDLEELMNNEKTKPTTIDEYIAEFPEDIQAILQEIRAVIRETAPEAEEAISYQMPTFKLKGNLVHFGAFKNHIGFYPAPTGIEIFEKELSPYKGAKGSVQFPLGQPMPLELIRKIVKFRVAENLEKADAKSKKKK
jgi:uncharacterized protein YdhG (YjbR/CyaY superfamily)